MFKVGVILFLSFVMLSDTLIHLESVVMDQFNLLADNQTMLELLNSI